MLTHRRLVRATVWIAIACVPGRTDWASWICSSASWWRLRG